MRNLEIDIETFSSVNLAKAGVYRYAESPDFEVLLFGYSIDGQDVKVVDLARGERIPTEILAALEDKSVTLVRLGSYRLIALFFIALSIFS